MNSYQAGSSAQPFLTNGGGLKVHLLEYYVVFCCGIAYAPFRRVQDSYSVILASLHCNAQWMGYENLWVVAQNPNKKFLDVTRTENLRHDLERLTVTS